MIKIGLILLCSAVLLGACNISQTQKSDPHHYSSSVSSAVTSQSAPKIDPRVQSKFSSAEMLRSMNTVLIAPVAFDASVTDLGSDSQYITRELEAAAVSELGVKIITKDDVLKMGKSMPSASARPAIGDLAKAVSADSILFTTINSFRGREGSAVGGEPGNLNFTVWIVRVSDGGNIWTGNYHFRDEALFQNLFKAGDRFDKESGAGWKDTKALIGTAFKDTLGALAEQRYGAFVKGK